MFLDWDHITPADLEGFLGQVADYFESAPPASWRDVVRGLVEVSGGDTVYIPALSQLEREARDRAIVADVEAGMTRKRVCRRYHISPRTLSRVMARVRPGLEVKADKPRKRYSRRKRTPEARPKPAPVAMQTRLFD